MSPEQIAVFRSLETALHKREVRNSRARVAALIADDFIEFGRSGGVYNKHDVLSSLEEEQTDIRIEVSDFAVRELAAEVVLVTYKTTVRDVSPASDDAALRSSIWINRDGRWQMTFHQGTRTR
jgi:hypothetical protein